MVGKILSTLVAVCLLGQVVAADLSHQMAGEMIARAIEKADQMGIAVAVAVVDQHGNLKAFSRMDGTYLVAGESAEMKAFTAASVPLSSAEIAELAAGDPNSALNNIPGFLLLPGGMPIVTVSGDHLGGIGIGGGSGEQDVEVARAALKVMTGEKMKQAMATREEMHLAGVTVRTNNAIEAERMTGKIFPCVMDYFHKGIADTIPERRSPGVTVCAYTDYKSDEHGDYTYFIGEEIGPDTPLPPGLERLYIPAQRYAKFTTGPAPMPDVVVNAWQEIWQMSAEDFGGSRRYHTDFELYDERAADEQNIVMDVYIGLQD